MTIYILQKLTHNMTDLLVKIRDGIILDAYFEAIVSGTASSDPVQKGQFAVEKGIKPPLYACPATYHPPEVPDLT